MKNFLNFINSEIQAGVESQLVRDITNNIVMKNRKASFQNTGKQVLNHLFNIAQTNYQSEVDATPHALASMQKPIAVIECSIDLCFTNNDSYKMQSLKALKAFEKEFLRNIEEHKNIYVK